MAVIAEVATTTNAQQATLQLGALGVLPSQMQSDIAQCGSGNGFGWLVVVLLAIVGNGKGNGGNIIIFDKTAGMDNCEIGAL